MSSTQQKQQQESPQINRKNSKISAVASRSPQKSLQKAKPKQAMDEQIRQSGNNNDIKDDESVGNQSELSGVGKALDKKQKLSLQELQRRRLGEELFLHKKHKMETLLESLMVNQHKCFPYETRYTPEKKGIFDDDISEETQSEQELQLQENKQGHEKSATVNKNEVKEAESIKKPKETSLSACIEQIEAQLRQIQMANNSEQGQDEFLDQVW